MKLEDINKMVDDAMAGKPTRSPEDEMRQGFLDKFADEFRTKWCDTGKGITKGEYLTSATVSVQLIGWLMQSNLQPSVSYLGIVMMADFVASGMLSDVMTTPDKFQSSEKAFASALAEMLEDAAKKIRGAGK